jgi:hypothetical protein
MTQTPCVATRYAFAICFLLALARAGGQTASPAIAPGSGRPIAGCGLICEPKAKLTLTVPTYAGFGGLLQNQPFQVTYTVTNTNFSTTQGVVNVFGNGQLLQDLDSQRTITLAPNQQFNGTVLVNSPPAGFYSLVAYYQSPFQCTGPIAVGRSGRLPVNCTGGQVYASAFSGVDIPLDADGDGLSDDYEQTILATYAPLMLFSRDHGSEEEYRPIDVIDYLHGSSLVSQASGLSGMANSALQQDSTQILGPCTNPGNVCAGKIAANQARTLPVDLFVAPSDSVKSGSSWTTVLARANVGLYGHVVPILPSKIPDPALATELSSYMSLHYPSGTPLLKVEYWQFFGYSHDYQVPIPLLPAPLEHAADHDGDWCSVQLYINPDEPAPDKAILVSYHYAHGVQFGFDFTQPKIVTTESVYQAESMPLTLGPTYQLKQFQGPSYGAPVNLPLGPRYNDVDEPCENTNDLNICDAQNNVVQMARVDSSQPYVHPVVYVEWGGHEFWPSKNWSFYGASKHGGDGYSYFAAAPPNVGEISHPLLGAAGQVLTGFAGYWGHWGGFENRNPPPQGPPLHREWTWYPPNDPMSVRPANLQY